MCHMYTELQTALTFVTKYHMNILRSSAQVQLISNLKSTQMGCFSICFTCGDN